MQSVSAVIPVFNGAKTIGRAIESVLAQTYKMLDIIVVDDGSSDGSAAIAERYPVTVIRQKNSGPASARNTGIRVAKSEWIAFLDSDDSWFPNKTEEQLKYIQPGVSAVFSEKFPGTSFAAFEDVWHRNVGGSPTSTIIRTDVLHALGLFDDDRKVLGTEDLDLWLRFTLAGYKFVGTPVYYAYTPSDGHLSGNLRKMLSAELATFTKIAALAGIEQKKLDDRLRSARLEYMPDLIAARELAEARRHLRALGFDRSTAAYWVASHLPVWALDLRRRLIPRYRSSVASQASIGEEADY